MSKETGGPAFPLHQHGTQTLGMHITGMTLRDYFAAKAMQSFMTVWMTQAKYPETDLEVAKYAYQMAAAMLEARK